MISGLSTIICCNNFLLSLENTIDYRSVKQKYGGKVCFINLCLDIIADYESPIFRSYKEMSAYASLSSCGC